MNIEVCDKAVSKVLRSIAKENIKPDVVGRAQKSLGEKIQNLPVSKKQLLQQEFGIVKLFWHEASRPPASEIVSLLEDLGSCGLPESAVVLFNVCIASLAKADFSTLKAAVPSVSCIKLWQKSSRTQVNSLLKLLSSSPDEYYDTVWYDWYTEKAPVKNLMPFARPVVQGRSRARSLPGAANILQVVLKRDKKFVLMPAILTEAVKESRYLEALISASSRVDGAGEAYARGLGNMLAMEHNIAAVYALTEAVRKLAAGAEYDTALYASRFAAHTVTAWALINRKNTPERIQIEKALLSIGINLFFLKHCDNASGFWISGTTGSINEEVLEGKGKVSPLAAEKIARAIRASQTDADPAAPFWAAAYNLGLREAGKPGDKVIFDPLMQEDIKGGLIPGDKAVTVRCGWTLEDTLLLRIQVEAGHGGAE